MNEALAKDAMENAEACLQVAEDEIILMITKGTDDIPAKQPEIDNLVALAESGSLSNGLFIGDHRTKITYVTEGAMFWIELANRWMHIAEIYQTLPTLGA